MADISNEKAISVMKTLRKGYLDLTDNRRIYKECFIVLDSIEAAIRALDDERDEGEWIETNSYDENVICPFCKTEFNGDIKLVCGGENPHFCPQCGAKMKLYGSEV